MVISQAGEWRVELDPDGLVHILDGERVIRASMSSVEWDLLCSGTDDYLIDQGIDSLG